FHTRPASDLPGRRGSGADRIGPVTWAQVTGPGVSGGGLAEATPPGPGAFDAANRGGIRLAYGQLAPDRGGLDRWRHHPVRAGAWAGGVCPLRTAACRRLSCDRDPAEAGVAGDHWGDHAAGLVRSGRVPAFHLDRARGRRLLSAGRTRRPEGADRRSRMVTAAVAPQ